eukprot:gene6465-10471_t
MATTAHWSFFFFITSILVQYFALLAGALLFGLLVLKGGYSFQANLYVTLLLTNFLRCCQFIVLFFVYTGGGRIWTEFMEFFDNLALGSGFAVYMSVAFFWAYQYYKHSDSGTLPKRSYVILYWIITILVMILATILSIFMIFFVEFNFNNDIYRMFRLMFRFILTCVIIFGLVFYGTGLFARLKSLEVRVDQKIYMKIALVSFICTVIYTFFIISNVFFFLIDHLIIDANLNWRLLGLLF